MTPEKQERLKGCLQELAAELYEETNKSELSDLESIEKTVRTQRSHSQLSPLLEKCCLRLSANESYQNAEAEVEALRGMIVGHSTQQSWRGDNPA